MERSRTRRGFTLIELLIVLSIIAILMGLLIPVIFIVRAQVKRAETVTTLGQIGAACESFQQTNGYYPDNASYQAAVDLASLANNNRLLRAQLETVDPENFSEQSSVVGNADYLPSNNTNLILDGFGFFFRYRPASKYGWGTGSGGLIDSNEPPNPRSYQLWSIGREAVDSEAEQTYGQGGNDINNWDTN